jgi:hypothetical protein
MQVSAFSNRWSAIIDAPVVNAEKHNPVETMTSTAIKLIRDLLDLGVEISLSAALRSSNAFGITATIT